MHSLIKLCRRNGSALAGESRSGHDMSVVWGWVSGNVAPTLSNFCWRAGVGICRIVSRLGTALAAALCAPSTYYINDLRARAGIGERLSCASAPSTHYMNGLRARAGIAFVSVLPDSI